MVTLLVPLVEPLSLSGASESCSGKVAWPHGKDMGLQSLKTGVGVPALIALGCTSWNKSVSRPQFSVSVRWD